MRFDHADNDADVIFLGIVGRDIAAGLLRSSLRERGVDDSFLVEDEHASTLHKLRILADRHTYKVGDKAVPPCLKTRFISRTYWRFGRSTQISVSSVVAGTPCRIAPLIPTI